MESNESIFTWMRCRNDPLVDTTLMVENTKGAVMAKVSKADYTFTKRLRQTAEKLRFEVALLPWALRRDTVLNMLDDLVDRLAPTDDGTWRKLK